MRISDWSIDVCSSDLEPLSFPVGGDGLSRLADLAGVPGARHHPDPWRAGRAAHHRHPQADPAADPAHRRPADPDRPAAAAAAAAALLRRTEERRGGEGCVRTCRYRWSTNHKTK